MDPEEAHRLPWWKERLYREGILWEFYGQESEETEYLEGSQSDLAGLGLSVQSI